MKNKMSKELRKALDAIESEPLLELLDKKKEVDLVVLKEMMAEHQNLKKGDLQKAIYALGKWGDKTVVSSISNIIPRLNVSERITAIDALTKLVSKEQINILLKYTKDESDQVRKMVVNALDAVGGKEALEELKFICENDSKPWLRQMAQDCLNKKK